MRALGPEDLQGQSDRLYDRLDLALIRIDQLEALKPPEPIVEDWLFSNSLAWLGGRPGGGKTFLAVDLACAVSAGQLWHNKRTRRGRVLYVIAEGAHGLAARVRAWEWARNCLAGDLIFLPIAVQLTPNSETLEPFVRLVTEQKPDMIVIDTQARVTEGMEENSSRDMGLFVAALERVRQASKACVLIVHHEPRSGENLRGSTALEGAATTVMRTAKEPRSSIVKVECRKQKDVEEQEPITLDLVTAPNKSAVLCGMMSHQLGPISQDQQDILQVLAEFPRGLYASSVGSNLGWTREKRSSVQLMLRQLHERGMVVREDEPHGTKTWYLWKPLPEPEPEPEPAEPEPEEPPTPEPDPELDLTQKGDTDSV